VLFALASKLSGASFFSGLTLATYNTFFTALPIMFYAIDQNIPAKFLLQHPQLYKDSAADGFMTPVSILYWVARSVFQACVTYGLTVAILGDAMDSFGSPFDQTELAFGIFLVAVTLQTFVVILESGSVTVLNVIAALWTYIGFYLFTWFFNLFPFFGFYHTINYLYRLPLFSAWAVLVIASAMVPILFEKAWRFNYYPRRYQALLARVRYQLTMAAKSDEQYDPILRAEDRELQNPLNEDIIEI